MSEGTEIKKLDRLETHDRLEYLKKKSFNIGECCQDLIDQKPFGDRPFYIFAHARTDDNEPGVKRIIWQPRLTRPKAQDNSLLFKVRPPSDVVEIIWILPPSDTFSQFLKDTMFKDSIIFDSINKYIFDKSILERKDQDDLSDEEVDKIYKEISENSSRRK